MKVTIFGAGYVGLVTGACLAEMGNDVLCVDINKARVQKLKEGICPIHEPGLPELIIQNVKAGRLDFTDDAVLGVNHGFYLFIAVGTPQHEDGSADLQYVYAVAQTIGCSMQDYRIVVTKSTVPVGTCDTVRSLIQTCLTDRKMNIHFDVASNPEFLREGAAIKDFMNSDRIIVGADSEPTKEHFKILYAPFNRNQDRLIITDPRSAELTKYAANALLATKISFMNEVSQLAEAYGADIEHIRIGLGSDPRIGPHFINAGCGYGGSCFPKDLSALVQMAQKANLNIQLIDAVQKVNEAQKKVLFHKMKNYFNNDLQGKKIALWGLAFKPNTDDMREAPSRALMELLWKEGAAVQVYDPVAMPEARQIYGERADLKFCKTPGEALESADALAIVTEWPVFSSPDFHHIKATLNQPVIFDGRNLYDSTYLKKLGFSYYAIGRGD
jgi:UDPglucose 6-dehydrogenase